MAIASITALLNNLELLGFDRKKHCKNRSIVFNVDLFTSSQDNVEAFQFISYFLFKSIDDQKTAFEFQSVWPIETFQQSDDFIDICIHLLNEYKRQNQYFESIQIKKSLLVDCSGEYIIHILLALSKIALDKIAADWEREENDSSIADNAEENHSHNEIETSSKQEIPLVGSLNNEESVDVEEHKTGKETSTPEESHLETKDDKGKREASRLERQRLRRETVKQIKQWGITPPAKRLSIKSNPTLEFEQSNLNVESLRMGPKEKLFEKNYALGESGKELVMPIRKSKPAEEKIPKGSLERDWKGRQIQEEHLKKAIECEREIYSNELNLLQHKKTTLRTEKAKYKTREERMLLRKQEIRLIKEHGLSNCIAIRDNRMKQHLEYVKEEKERMEHEKEEKECMEREEKEKVRMRLEKKEKEWMEREVEIIVQKEKADAIIREKSRLLEAETAIKHSSNKKADVLEKTLDPSDHLEIDRREVKRLKNEADEKLKANHTELERLQREQVGLNASSLKKIQAEQKRLKEEQTTLLERARIRGLHEECLELGYSLRKQLAVLEREEVKVLGKENIEREKLQKEVAGIQSTSDEEESVESESQTKDNRDDICQQQVKTEDVEDTKEHQQLLLQSSRGIEKENARSALNFSAKKSHKLPYEKLSHPSEFRYKILQILSRPVEEVEEFNLLTLSQSASKNVAVSNDFTTSSQESIGPPLRPFSGIRRESPKRSFDQVDKEVKLEPSPKRLK